MMGARAALLLVAVSVVGIVAVSAARMIGRPALSRDDAERLAHAPLATVLLSGAKPTVAVVDLEQGRVLARIPLRSFSLSMDTQAEEGRVVTAQSGMGADAADAVFSVIDVRGGGGIREIRARTPEPSEVVAVGDRAIGLHGFVKEGGLAATVVDLARGKVTKEFVLPDGACGLSRAGGAVYYSDSVGASSSVMALDLESLESRVLLARAPVGARTYAGAAAVAGSVLVVGNREQSPASGSRVVRLDPASGSVIASAALDTHNAVEGVAEWGERIALMDSDLLEGTKRGSVRLLDAVTLADAGRLEGTTFPVAVATWRDALLVMDGATGDLLVYDSGMRSPARRVHVGDVSLVARLGVLP